MIAYIENYCDRIYWEDLLQNCLPFDPYDRTSYDTVVSAMITLVSSLDTVAKPPPKKNPLIKTYPNIQNQQMN
jgi:hypothetical protein